MKRNTIASLGSYSTGWHEYWGKGMLYVAECMALGATELVKQPELLKKAWELHDKTK